MPLGPSPYSKADTSSWFQPSPEDHSFSRKSGAARNVTASVAAMAFAMPAGRKYGG